MTRSSESSVVRMYSEHPSPGHRDKLGAADRRMELRLHCCGVRPEDWVDRRVLDAGCGTGEYALWFARNGADVTGIDLSEGSLREARSYADGHGLDRVSFERRSVLDTGLETSSFDLVYCTGVLHHTPAPFDGFRELCRVTKPSGKLLVSLYNAFGFLPRAARWWLVRVLADDDPEDRVRWARRLFPRTARRLRDAGFNDPETGLYDYFGVERQSLHSLGELLSWLDRCGMSYCGGFPPVRLRDYPAMFAHPAFRSVEEEFRGPVQRFLGRLGDPDQLGDGRCPGIASRAAVQLLWLATGVGVFGVCGEKTARSDR